MTTETEAEFDKNVKIIRGSFAQYPGQLIIRATANKLRLSEERNPLL